MITKELLDYIRTAKSQNISDNQIRETLIASGWNRQDVNSAFLSTPPSPPSPVQTLPTGEKAGPSANMWDGFEHILMFLSLYALATAISILLHTYVDRWIPNITEYGRSRYNATSYFSNYLITGSLAAIIVSFPLFAFFHIHINKKSFIHPVIRSLKVRKFFIYATLVVTFLIGMGNIIAAVYSFLTGNFTTNFLSHLSVTLAIVGTMFFYYLQEVKEDRKIYA